MATVDEKDKIDKKEDTKKKRQFNRIVFKRKDVLWGLIIKGQIVPGKLSNQERGRDTYGHWWVEINNESYGWWPDGQVDFLNTIKGVDGVLNWGRGNQDPDHGTMANEEFCMIVDKEDTRSVDSITKIIRDFATNFHEKTNGWRYPAIGGYDNCHTFQKKMIKKCDFYKKGKTTYRKYNKKTEQLETYKVNETPKNVEEVS